ncbi:hypothetical protein HQ447_15415 [bacterium]|nr:hypothetical protein [bacterium]
MKILVRPGSTIKEKTPSVSGFLNSLGAQAARYAEPQSCEVVFGQISFRARMFRNGFHLVVSS